MIPVYRKKNSEWADRKLKLKVGHVRVMRFRLEAGVSVSEIAETYKLNPLLVEGIENYQAFPHIPAANKPWRESGGELDG